MHAPNGSSEDFIGEAIATNVAYLRRQNGKDLLVDQLLSGRKSFVGEVEELFYFFRSPGQRLKIPFKTPALREGHDERLGRLETTLNEISIATYSLENSYGQLGRKLDEHFRAGRSLNEDVETREMIQARQMYECLRGDHPIDASKLGVNSLRERFSRLKKVPIRMGIFLGAATYFAINMNIPFIELDPVFLKPWLFEEAGLVGLGLMGLNQVVSHSIPFGYHMLDIKANGADRFLQKHRDLI